MSDFNPYQPPIADVSEPEGEGPALAGRGRRLGAALIDSLISLALMMPVFFGLKLFDTANLARVQTLEMKMTLAAIGFVIFSLVHSYLLMRHGQTIGKRLLGIRIVDMAFNKPDLGTLLLGRYLPVILLRNLPMVGPFISLADVLFIFRRDRRCVHDMIAGTQVVKCR